jgi:hypothetical protein
MARLLLVTLDLFAVLFQLGGLVGGAAVAWLVGPAYEVRPPSRVASSGPTLVLSSNDVMKRVIWVLLLALKTCQEIDHF